MHGVKEEKIPKLSWEVNMLVDKKCQYMRLVKRTKRNDEWRNNGMYEQCSPKLGISIRYINYTKRTKYNYIVEN